MAVGSRILGMFQATQFRDRVTIVEGCRINRSRCHRRVRTIHVTLHRTRTITIPSTQHILRTDSTRHLTTITHTLTHLSCQVTTTLLTHKEIFNQLTRGIQPTQALITQLATETMETIQVTHLTMPLSQVPITILTHLTIHSKIILLLRDTHSTAHMAKPDQHRMSPLSIRTPTLPPWNNSWTSSSRKPNQETEVKPTQLPRLPDLVL